MALNEAEAKGRAAVQSLRIPVTVLFLVTMVPLLVTPVAPLIDFYNHLARFFVLSHIEGNPFLQANYTAHWTLLPNIGVDLLAIPLLAFLPPLLAGHLIIGLLMALQYGGVLHFNRQLTGQTSLLVALLLLPFLYSYVLNWGFANFLLGLGLAFWGAGWWLSHRDRPRLAVPVSCGLALLIFFSHGIAFVMYGLMLVLLEIGFFLQDRCRDVIKLFWQMTYLVTQAVVPVGLFLLWQSGTATGASIDIAPKAVGPFFARLVHGFFRHIDPLLRVAEGPALWFDVATLLVMAIFIIALVRGGRITIARPARPLAAVALIVALVPIPTLFSVGHIADRTPLFAAFVLLGSLSVRAEGWIGRERSVAALLTALVLLRLGAVAWDWHRYGDTYREYVDIAGHIPADHTVAPIMVAMGHHETTIPRSEMYGPLLVPLYSQAVPLFSDERQQPLLMSGTLGASAKRMPPPPLAEDDTRQDYGGYIKSAAAAGFDYLLICNADRMNQPLPSNTRIVAKSVHFILLKSLR